METSAPKRRKTSPTTSVRIDEPASSNSVTRRSSRPNRTSFASPTKASLARSNPDILQRRNSSKDSPALAPAASEPGSPTSQYGGVIDYATAQFPTKPETWRVEENGQGKNGNATLDRPTSPVRRIGGALSKLPKRSPIKPSPRPLPPPSAEEEELIDPFKGRRMRRSPPPGILPEVGPEEPELPPTPTQKGLSDPSSIITSPMGIHNTPSKRPRKSRALAERLKSSPLKQPPLRPPDLGTDIVHEASSSQSIPLPFRDEPRQTRSMRTAHTVRQVEEVDPFAEKKALRDALLAEVAQLEEDLKVASRENERLYHLQRSSRNTADLPSSEERSRLLDVLSRHALPPEKEAPLDPMQDWLEAAMNPIAFLPFGQANAVALPPFALPGPENEGEADPPPPASHHPVPMTADEELPYLQVFTPLTFTSTVTTIPRDIQEEEDQQPLLQRHEISVASSPPGYFVATIDMSVNSKTLSIAELAVPRLDPSAISELGPFLEKILRGRSNNSALTRNVSVITWAMGEWVRLATRRAKFWHAVQQDLGSAERLALCAREMRQNTRRKAGRRLEDEEEEQHNKEQPSKADVASLLGRTSFDLDLSSEEDKALTARIQWRIEFDWTGEARSQIGILVGAPAKWHANDPKRSLAGLPDMFDKLLQESKDPIQAVKTVVALIVGDGQP